MVNNRKRKEKSFEPTKFLYFYKQTNQALSLFLIKFSASSSSERGDSIRRLREFSISHSIDTNLPIEYHIDPVMQITDPMIPIGFILLLNSTTDKMIITTCFTFPTTFIISGPPSFTALKFAIFSMNASIPWNTSNKIAPIFALHKNTKKSQLWKPSSPEGRIIEKGERKDFKE